MTPEPSAYVVEPARLEDCAKLARVELSASRLFDGTGLLPAVGDDVTPLDEFRHAQAVGRLWVARPEDREPVGFALVELLDGEPHLGEMDVMPAHGRRGLGRALLGAVLAWARAGGYRIVTLTTFREPPWNAAFYARVGFRALEPREIGPALAARMREETARGLDPATRLTMGCRLEGSSP